MLPVLAAIVLVILAAGLGLSFYFTKRAYLKFIHTPAEVGLAFEEVSFTTTDGLTLHGWIVPGPIAGKAVILLHGHGGSMDYDIDYLLPLHAAGYTVLQFDLRAHGRSQGRAITFGFLEREDVRAAVRFIVERGWPRVALVGFSLGGMCAINGAPLCPEVAVVIEDGGPVRMLTALHGWCKERGIPDWIGRPLGWLTLAVTGLRFGVNIFTYEPVRQVGKIAPRPLMLIHGDRDQYVTDFADLVAAAGPAEVWRLAEEGHTTASRSIPIEYWQRVTAFLCRYL